MKPTIPEVLPLVNEYLKKEGSSEGGSFHILLADDNVRDSDVEFCLKQCIDRKENLGIVLGEKLLLISKTQRLKIAYLWDDPQYD